MERKIAAYDADRQRRSETTSALLQWTRAGHWSPEDSPLRSHWLTHCESCPRHLWLKCPVRPPTSQESKREWPRVPNWWQCSAYVLQQQRSRMTRMMPPQTRMLRLKQLEAKRVEHGWAMRGSTAETLAPRSCRCRPSESWCPPWWSPCRLPNGEVSTEANRGPSEACACAALLASRTGSSRRSCSAAQGCAYCRRTTGGSDHTPRVARTCPVPHPIVSVVTHCGMNQMSARASRDWLK
jgi:hypothetical protein